MGFSGVALEEFDDDRRQSLLDDANAYEATLYPGEAIFMPMLIWHYLEYTDDAMSVNSGWPQPVRALRVRRQFSPRLLHPDLRLETPEEAECYTTFGEDLGAIIAEYARPATGSPA